MQYIDFKNFINKEFILTETQFSQFEALEALYKEWNSQINVISRKDIEELYKHHVLHALCIALYLKFNKTKIYHKLLSEGAEILDLGTGGGFPGIPLAILFPKCRFTLCDSVGKKIIVAKAVSSSLGLNNTTCVHGRAEELKQEFQYVVSRAVSSLDKFYPWVKDKFTDNIFYLKGGDIIEELSSLMQKFKLNKNNVSTWKIDSYIDDSYFINKMIVDISK